MKLLLSLINLFKSLLLIFMLVNMPSVLFAFGKKSDICGSWNNYCQGGTRVQSYSTKPVGPSAQELKEQWEAQDLKDASWDAYDTGVEFLEKQEWGNAIVHFEEALDYNPDNLDAITDLKKAKEKLREAYLKQQEETAQKQKKIVAKKKVNLVQQEQLAYEKRDKAWMNKQKELIAKAVKQQKKTDETILKAIEQNRVPKNTDKQLKDLQPGDVILVKADNSFFSQAITYGDTLLRWLHVKSLKPKKYNISHSLVYLKTINGKKFFLDHQLGDKYARVIDEKTFLNRYKKRLSYVAKPKTLITGQQMWSAAKKAALKNETPYGVFGSSIVCSELTRFAIVQASHKKLSFLDEQRWGPIEMTPADFIDPNTHGRYFTISNLTP